jgi:hypothetical protein
MPGSSLVAEADARVMDRAELWRRLEKPGLEPIVRLASTPEGRVGRDRVALLYVIPLRADESEWGLKMLRTSPLAPVLTGFAQGRLGPTPGFRVVEPAIDTTLAGLPGARIELRYEGEHGPTFEHMHVTRRLNEYWYLRVMVPEALDAESQAWLETIPEIFQLDPDLDP